LSRSVAALPTIPYDWRGDMRTKPKAHQYIEQHWHELSDGDVGDVSFEDEQIKEANGSGCLF
jgi:hypothetical protein